MGRVCSGPDKNSFRMPTARGTPTTNAMIVLLECRTPGSVTDLSAVAFRFMGPVLDGLGTHHRRGSWKRANDSDLGYRVESIWEVARGGVWRSRGKAGPICQFAQDLTQRRQGAKEERQEERLLGVLPLRLGAFA